MCPTPPCVLWPPPQPEPWTTGANHKASPGSLSHLFVSVLPGLPGHSSHWSPCARRVRLCRWATPNEGSAGGIANVKTIARSVVLQSVPAAFHRGKRWTWVGRPDAAPTRRMVGLARGGYGRFLLLGRRLAGRLCVVEVLLGRRYGAPGNGLAPDRGRDLRLDGGGAAPCRSAAPAEGIARRGDAFSELALDLEGGPRASTGTLTRTVVPRPPGPAPSWTLPPSSRARSRIPSIPNPPDRERRAGRPRPSSVTATRA